MDKINDNDSDNDNDTRLKVEDVARLKTIEDFRLKAEEIIRQKAAEEAVACQRAIEARLIAEDAARQKAIQAAMLKTEEEARRKAIEAARLDRKEAARQKAAELTRLKAEEAARQKDMKRKKEDRTKLSKKIGKDRANGRSKGPGLDRKEALLVGKILAETCKWEDLERTDDELGGRWFEGGTFFHFLLGWVVVPWLSEGFWNTVENESIEIIIIIIIITSFSVFLTISSIFFLSLLTFPPSSWLAFIASSFLSC